LQIHAADPQDCHGVIGVFAAIRHLCPWLRHVSPMAAIRQDEVRRCSRTILFLVIMMALETS
jgi:hypothetical protein